MQTLKKMPIWVVWKYETVNGKRTKVLYSAKTKNKCGTNEKYKAGWALFEEASDVASNASFDGVGFVIPRDMQWWIWIIWRMRMYRSKSVH